MAKRRKEKDEEEELDFKLPKFDEERFLKKERRNIKTTFLSFLFGLLISFISFGFWTLLHESDFRWELVLLVCVANATWIRYLFFRLNIDLTDFGKKGWFGSYAIYFFTWAIVLIILINPPFHDDEAPRVDIVTLPNVQEFGGTVELIALMVDNVGVEKQDIVLSLTYPDGTNHSPDFNFEDNIFSYTFENADNLSGEFKFKITATDVNKHTVVKEGSFKYTNDVIVLTTPKKGSDLYSYTPIEFKINSDVFTPIEFTVEGDTYTKDFRVYYRVDDGVEINVSRLDENNMEDYRSTAEFNGWKKNDNVSLKSYVEVSYYFININKKFSNLVENPTVYNFKTLDDDNIGSEELLIPPSPIFKLNADGQYNNALNYYLPDYTKYEIPGFELIVFIISLAAVVLIFKYRKKDRRN